MIFIANNEKIQIAKKTATKPAPVFKIEFFGIQTDPAKNMDCAKDKLNINFTISLIGKYAYVRFLVLNALITKVNA